MSRLDTSEAPNSRKGWLIVGLLFLMLALMISARNSLGLMMPFWKDDPGWSYQFVSTVGAVMMIVMAVGAPVIGFIVDRWGSRLVYTVGMLVVAIVYVLSSRMTEAWELLVLFGLVGGLAFAAMSPSLASTTIAHHFNSRLGLATSLATSGSTGGQFALMPLLAFLVTAYSWRDAFLIVAVSVLMMAAVIFILIGREPPRPRSSGGAKSQVLSTLRKLGRQPVFWLLGGGFFVCGFTTAGTVKIHLIPYAVTCGFAPLESATAYGVLSLFSMLGMIAYGWLSDRYHRPLLLAGCYFVRALTFILLFYIVGDPVVLYLFAILFGIFDYATFPVVASLVATHIGRHIMGATMGLIFALHSLGGALGSYMGGYIFELFARYDWVWLASLALALLAAFLTILIKENREPVGLPAAA